MRKLSVVALVVSVALIAAGAADAVTPFEDDFDAYTNGGTLYGQVAPTGQTWLGSGVGMLSVSDAFGRSGLGAGASMASGAASQACEIFMASPAISTGEWRFSVDLMRTGAAVHYVYLRSGTDWVRFGWGDNADTGTTTTGVGVMSSVGGVVGAQGVDVGYSTGWMHVDLDIDLDTGVSSASWYDLDAPGDANRAGSMDFSLSPGVFTINNLKLFASSRTGGDVGMDNVSVSEVPEPATLSLLAIGSVLALRRRRRAA